LDIGDLQALLNTIFGFFSAFVLQENLIYFRDLFPDEVTYLKEHREANQFTHLSLDQVVEVVDHLLRQELGREVLDVDDGFLVWVHVRPVNFEVHEEVVILLLLLVGVDLDVQAVRLRLNHLDLLSENALQSFDLHFLVFEVVFRLVVFV